MSAREGAAKLSRRDFCIGAGGVVTLCALGGLHFVGSAEVLRPPGGQNEDALLASCLRCGKCMEACPRGIIKPLHIEDGIAAMRTPALNFSANWCDWCADEYGSPRCVAACPTDALSLQADATAETTIIGKASITEDWCLAYRMTGCRSCYDACPYGAIALDERMRPHVDEEKCNGCGACEAACVSLSSGSIVADATDRAITVGVTR